MAMKFDNHRFVFRPDGAEEDRLSLLGRARGYVLLGIGTNRKTWQIFFPSSGIVQSYPCIQRDQAFRRSQQRVDIDLLNPALLRNQAAEAHEHVIESG